MNKLLTFVSNIQSKEGREKRPTTPGSRKQGRVACRPTRRSRGPGTEFMWTSIATREVSRPTPLYYRTRSLPFFSHPEHSTRDYLHLTWTGVPRPSGSTRRTGRDAPQSVTETSLTGFGDPENSCPGEAPHLPRLVGRVDRCPGKRSRVVPEGLGLRRHSSSH